jgi:hypothetical protein
LLQTQQPEATPDKRAVLGIHTLIEAVLWTVWTVTDIKRFPAPMALRAIVDLIASGITTEPAAKDVIGALIFPGTERGLTKRLPD